MSTMSRDEFAEVFQRVERWPEEARRSLIAKIVGTFSEPVSPAKPRGNPANLFGLLKTDGPPPTDEEIDQMREDELMRKYGS